MFVPRTLSMGSPAHMSVGTEINPPPPTTESMNAAINPMPAIIAMAVKSNVSNFSTPNSYLLTPNCF